MNRKELHESLATLYLRLNGYFTAGFIVHSPLENEVLTEIDLIAVRFPHSREPEREIDLAPELTVPDSRIDFLICEVKAGKSKGPQFNSALRKDLFAIAAVLRRAGIFPEEEVPEIAEALRGKLTPDRLAGSSIPTVEGLNGAQVRAVLFATGRRYRRKDQAPFIHGKQILDYIWACLCPEDPRPKCATKYSYEMWGDPNLVSIVRYFKEKRSGGPGSIKALESTLCPG